MDFYESIAKYYHHIFPLNVVQVDFIRKSHFRPANKLSILDIGCAVGDLSLELSKQYQEIIGIDLDSKMITSAKQKAGNIDNLNFQLENMLNLNEVFGPNCFDLIVCFGNTLVHLASEKEIHQFFANAKTVLKKDGKLLFQIVNYDRIIDKNINHLPSIENKFILFERNYHYQPDKNLVDFETILTIKRTGNKIKNQVPLLALRKASVHRMLLDTGFHDIKYFGTFKRDLLTDSSMPLIVEAKV